MTLEDWSNPDWAKTAARPSDPPLSAAGLEVASQLGESFLNNTDVKHIISSPLERCVMTANEIAKRLGLQIKIDNGIIDNLGDEPTEPQEPNTVDELAKLYPIDTTYIPSTTVVPHVESKVQLEERTKVCMDYLIAKYPGESFVVVSHAATAICCGRAIIGDYSYLFRTGVCSLSKITKSPETSNKWSVEYTGNVSFLKDGEQRHWEF
eukprot:gene10729-12488_t